MKLDDYRKDIDTIDKEITELLEKRINMVHKIGMCKQVAGKPVLDVSRETDKLVALKSQTSEEFYSYISDIFREIMSQSRRYQEEHKVEYGLLGRKLGHSFSPQLHKSFGGYNYGLFETEPENLEKFLKNSRLKGFNVTIPYKKDVIKYCGRLSETAAETESVNTIVRNKDGSLAGYNTDYYGLDYLMKSGGYDVEGAKVLILGSGGVSGTVRQLVRDRHAAEVVMISRTGVNNYENIHKHYDADFIINTTPVGMYPGNGESAIDIKNFKNCKGLIDLIYNPIRTEIVLQAQKMGIKSEGGLRMLTAQAAKACEIFTGIKIPDEKIEAEYMKILRRMENIILIGMPGCGKTSIGKELAEITGKEFTDTDLKIIEQTGKSAEEIINSDGEAAFRRIETEIIRNETCRTGCVIATGGGVVTRERNLYLLRQNGRIVYIKRALDELSSDGRPLSVANKLEDLFEQRKDAYETWSSFRADNTGITETADNIAQMLGYGRKQ